MAGGVNPFGFTAGIIPAPRAPRQPQDLPSAPFGFAPPPSKMQQTLAILNEYNPLPAFERLMNSPMALGGPISEQDIADGLMVSGSVMGGSAAAPKPRNALNMGIRAYHGSPHDFPPVRLIEMPDGQRLYQNMNELADTPQGARIIQEFPLGRFDMSKIGTGEGAQAYGHGLYFAENEGVAKGYKTNLSYKHLKDRFLNELPQDAEFSEVEELMAQGYFTPDQTRLLTELRNNDWLGFDYPSQAITAATRGKLGNYDPTPELEDAADKIGKMYEVEINADPDTFLDWDKPLSEQPKNVQEALAKLDPELWHPSGSDYDPLELGQTAYMRAQTKRYSVMGPDGRFGPGGRTYDESLAMAGGDPKKVKTITDGAPSNRSEALKQAGIPGIKYLDAGSRGAGDGSRNYVVFDQNLISIVRKYGIAGASAMLGYNILDGMDPAQADELKRIEGNQ